MKDYFAHSTSTIDDGAVIGQNSKIWHYSHVMPTAIIGDGCIIGQNVFVGSNVKIGDRVKIQNNVSLYEGVLCSDDVFIGPSVVFTNVINPRSYIERKEEFKKTIIEIGASIGANSTIVCGNRIGQYAMIGAAAVVTKEVHPYTLVVGNPAKAIGWVSEYGDRLYFNNDNEAICDRSGDLYILNEGIVNKVER